MTTLQKKMILIFSMKVTILSSIIIHSYLQINKIIYWTIQFIQNAVKFKEKICLPLQLDNLKYNQSHKYAGLGRRDSIVCRALAFMEPTQILSLVPHMGPIALPRMSSEHRIRNNNP